MEKVLHPFNQKIGSYYRPVFISIEIKDGELSISGVIGPKSNGNAFGGCGQIDMEYAHRNPEDDDKRYSEPVKPSELKFMKGWNAELWLDLLDVWKKWHLNRLTAGTPEQEEYLDSLPGGRGDYRDCTMILDAAGLNSEYKYGSAWLKKELPESVIQFLQNLPDSDVVPNWV